MRRGLPVPLRPGWDGPWWRWWAAAVILATTGQPTLWSSSTQVAAGVIHRPDALGAALVVLIALPLTVAPWWPLAAIGVSGGALFSYDALGYASSPADVAFLALVCWMVRVGRPRISVAAMVVLTSGAAIASGVRPGGHSAATLFGDVIVLPVAALVGVSLREHRLRTEATQREQEVAMTLSRLDKERLIAAERLRIAREVHDSIGHQVTLVALRAAAAGRLIHRDPDRAEALLEATEAISQETMAELHQFLGYLREEDPPARSEGDLRELCRRFQGLGLDVRLVVDEAACALTTYQQAAAAAVVAEGLANAFRHADAHVVWVRLITSMSNFVVEVDDDGRGPGEGCALGHGLAGATERVRADGGELAFGRSPAGGSLLKATFPLSERSDR